MTPRAAFPLLVASVLAWLAWVVAASVRAERSLSLGSPYLVAPVVLLAGILAGRILAELPRRWRVPELVVAAGLVFLVAVPLYLNAQGAVGVQLVALAGIILLGKRPGRGPNGGVSLLAVAVTLGVIGVLLAARSDASATLVLPLAVFVAVIVSRGEGPRRGPILAGSVGLLAVAAAGVTWLGSLDAWPERLRASSSLSQARHTLWSDALALWRTEPIVGAGPGAFRESSALAASNPDLATVHSSVLQVGAELGLVGCFLFGSIVLSGLLVACLGSRASASIAMAAWTALGIHSVIDHLYEFPVVVLSAGAVLGWAGHRSGRESSSGGS